MVECEIEVFKVVSSNLIPDKAQVWKDQSQNNNNTPSRLWKGVPEDRLLIRRCFDVAGIGMWSSVASLVG
jgi:hypothetical protein